MNKYMLVYCITLFLMTTNLALAEKAVYTRCGPDTPLVLHLDDIDTIDCIYAGERISHQVIDGEYHYRPVGFTVVRVTSIAFSQNEAVIRTATGYTYSFPWTQSAHSSTNNWVRYYKKGEKASYKVVLMHFSLNTTAKPHEIGKAKTITLYLPKKAQVVMHNIFERQGTKTGLLDLTEM